MSSTLIPTEGGGSTATDRLLRSLRSKLRGRILTSSDAGYDSARQVYNGRIDRLPDAIVSCLDVDDVISALRIAREQDISLAVRGSGHSSAGFGVCHRGIVLDLSAMQGVEIYFDSRVACIRVGATWGEFDQATQTHRLATTGARISTTNVIGVTLGGGYGWLMRKCGLAVDNLLAASLITADAQIISVNQTEHPELFWALRGGCGNFGVVTSMTLRLHPIGPLVTCGVLYYPVQELRSLLRGYRQIMLDAGDEVGSLFNVLIAPDAPFVPSELRRTKVVAIALCDTGTDDAAQARLAPFKALGRPLLDTLKPRPYVRLQQSFDHAGAFGNHVFGRSGHLPALTDDAIEVIAEHAQRITSPLSVVMICALGGAVARVGEHDTAFSHRRTPFDLSINAVWQRSDAAAHKHIAWVNDFWTVIRPFTNGAYVNELGDEGNQRIREAYNPQTYQRLVEIKRRYDPNNFFRLNHNIKPD